MTGSASSSKTKIANAGSRPAGAEAVKRGGVQQTQPQPRLETSKVEASPERPAAATAVETIVPSKPPFPVIGIGASAGGLEALEQFLRHLPDKSDMAFVVIQHLDPAHKGAMVEILQRSSPLPVLEVEDRMKVEPDHVYVIPPGKDMSILHGVLHLLPLTSPRGLNLPVDFFFRSLAQDRQEGGIGVVLSGMGSDGTLGLRAIKEKAGATFVQSLSSAKFDGMPRSAIDAGLADVVAPVEELPDRIIAYHRHAPYIRPSAHELGGRVKHETALEKVLVLVRAQSGNDFSLYKRSTVERRIERRMGLHQIDNMGDYVRYLRENPREAELLFKELLIGVTSFFRDPDAWECLRREALPELLRTRSRGGVLRAWVPACSTGEEPYSLAIVLTEALEEATSARNLSVQIFATDLDKDAIDRARQGRYPPNVAADITPERLRRFFVQDEEGYQVRKEVRESIIFAPQNVITDPPFTKLDILSCRNLLIYLSSEVQKKLIPLFHYSLNPGGILFLGTAETVGTATSLFDAVSSKARLYRRLETPLGAPPVEFPSARIAQEPLRYLHEGELMEAAKASPPDLQTLADRVVAQRFAPAAVLTNEKGDILYVSAPTGKYLELPVGKAHLNIFAMAKEGLRFELSGAFATALREERPIKVRGVNVRTNGAIQTIDVTIQKLREPKELRGLMMIVIADIVAAPEMTQPQKAKRGTSRTVALEKELQRAREEAQTIREEMQTSQEELKSTNEELQSTNEELQSTNEELTTSKEEMQSMNEELQTVNQELQSKIDDLAHSNNDMRNLLNSTEIATLFLDNELLVRRFTTSIAKIMKLIPSDVGRPITDIASDLDYSALVADAREVLRTLVFKETKVASRDGRWFTVRIMPYRTLENVIDGVVITFMDATAASRLETMLRGQTHQLQRLADALPHMVWGCRPDGQCNYLSRQWIEYTGVPEQEQLGDGWLERVHPDDRKRVRNEWMSAVNAGTPLDTDTRIRSKDGAYRWFKTRSAPIRDEHGVVIEWYGTHTDVDELKRGSEDSILARLAEWTDDAALVLDSELAISSVNAAAERALGHAREELTGKRLRDVVPETAGPPFEDALREALRRRRDVSFDVRLDGRPGTVPYRALAVPVEEGVALFLRKHEEGRPLDGR